MTTRLMTITRFSLVIASVLIACACGYTPASADDSPQAKELAQACQTAKANFRPITKDDIASRQKELLRATESLDKRLTEAGQNGDAWRKFLQLTPMKVELEKAQPDVDLLTTIYQKKYLAGHEGLGLVWFLDTRYALLRYIETRRTLDNAQIKTEYEQLIDKLAGQLAVHAATPSPESALAIGYTLRWLEDAGQAPQVIDAVHRHFLRPNLVVEASAAFLAGGMNAPVDEVEPLCDCILKTQISGSAHTVGSRRVVLQQSDDRAVLDTLFQGTAQSQTVGLNGPVCIYSNSCTTLSGCKRVWITADGLFAQPAVADANTSTTICDIQARNGSQLIEKAAWRRAGKQKGRAECIASQRAEARLSKRMDSEGEKTLAEANKNFQEKFRKTLMEHKMFPQSLRFSSTAEALKIVALQASAFQVGSPSEAPQTAGAADVVVRVHETMVNNAAASMLAGMIVRDETFRERMTALLGELPDRMKPEADQEPLSVGFAPDQPITVAFADGGYTLVIRGQHFFKGNDSYPGMHVTAKYKFEKSPKGFKIVRQGPLQILPPGAAEGAKLSARQIAIKTILDRRFGKILEPQIEVEEIVLKGAWAKVGKLQPAELTARDGWLLSTWKVAPKEAQPVAASK